MTKKSGFASPRIHFSYLNDAPNPFPFENPFDTFAYISKQ